ncbi:Isopropylmalate dehydrogenase-like domain-containing protein [Leucosporidium creatinivorum]|uniref:3-isopropylmalate dehydrogenase n=1 Tax=Leucosporidium creatinivorum TaxID=106004 RepID=A0A1Y2G4A7_9BASI|nr:Isopropylmalate dehydrogenase-like domain-containing protein [Leucosporidium creatinivorum]
MPSYKITSLPGDGIGPEVTAEAVRVLETLSAHSDLKFAIEEHDFGGIAIDNHQNPLPESTLAACQSADAILLGAVGGPKWGTHPTLRPEIGLLALRKALGLYANIRPANFPAPSLVSYSPLKAHIAEGTSIVVVRELIGGIYFGDRKEAVVGATEGEDAVARDECSYSVKEVERITRLGAYLAGLSNPPLPVHSVDKANVLATSRLWRKVVGDTMAKEFPEIPVDHQLVDSAAMVICSNPRKLNGILLTENLFGDILSDETSVIPGSLGLLPSASLGGIPDGKSQIPGLYEPIHGSAPDIAGQQIANPIGTILSIALMLRYSFGKEKEAKLVEEAVRIVLDDVEVGGFGFRTKDLGGDKGTKEVGDKVVEVLTGLLTKA